MRFLWQYILYANNPGNNIRSYAPDVVPWVEMTENPCIIRFRRPILRGGGEWSCMPQKADLPRMPAADRHHG